MATSKCIYKELHKTFEFYYQQFPCLRKLIEDKQTPEGSVYLSTAVTDLGLPYGPRMNTVMQEGCALYYSKTMS